MAQLLMSMKTTPFKVTPKPNPDKNEQAKGDKNDKHAKNDNKANPDFSQ